MKKVYCLILILGMVSCGKDSGANLVNIQENISIEELIELTDRAKTDDDIRSALLETKRLTLDTSVAQKNDFNQKNILIFDLGMEYPALIKYPDRVSGFYAFDRGKTHVGSDKIYKKYVSENISLIDRILHKRRNDKNWKMYSKEGAKLNKNIFVSGLYDTNVYIGHGDPVFYTIAESTKKSNIIVIQDLNREDQEQDFGPYISCGYFDKVEDLKDSIDIYFNELSEEIVKIVREHNIGYMNASWGLKPNYINSRFSRKCRDRSYYKDLVSFYHKSYNKIFEKVIENGAYVFQASAVDKDYDKDSTVTEVLQKFESDCAPLKGRYRVANSSRLSSSEIQSIPFEGTSYRAIYPSVTHEILRSQCSDVIVARSTDKESEIKEGFVLMYPNFYSRVNSKSSSYITPFVLTYAVNLVEKGIIKHSEMDLELSKMGKLIDLKNYPLSSWFFQLDQEDRDRVLEITY